MRSARYAKSKLTRSVPILAALVLVLAIGGCVRMTTLTRASEAPFPTEGDAALEAPIAPAGEPLTAGNVVHELSRAGFAVPNALDTTAQECPTAGCDQAIVTDTLRVKSFADSSLARRYAAARGLHRIGTVVVSFAPPIGPADRHEYWRQLENLVRQNS